MMEVTQIIIITNENFQGDRPEFFTTKEKYVDHGYILVKKIFLDGNGEVTIVNINGSQRMFSGFKYEATTEVTE
ncbi:hypothetical protein DUK53_16805 [Listeria sp. SHR_NRA_18]|uniref:hypothetical protein n=1 Tax=Listeria sp. SHR_NRA_18 TaxID=2269046 RepID=UPI000F5F4610|nr:hypothetical protein [Listeria sp. SHR_NRA_18]RQW65348.1 hypothetical protein DUK53_16805 [Listeria sp. SHR_NRA_18]